MSNKLAYIGFAFPHHKGNHAGYHHILDSNQYDYIIDAQYMMKKYDYSRFHNRLRRKIFRYLFWNFAIFPWYLFKCVWMALTKGHITFHFIYGENLYAHLPLLRIRGCKVVCTLHQPFEWFTERPRWTKRVKSMDHIILVGEKEVNLFARLTGRKNVTFIPHGICTDFYCPEPQIQKQHMLLTVGNWLRDFRFADNVYQQLLRTDKSLKICVVSLPDNKKLLTPHPRLQYLSGITDEALKGLYQECAVLFLPLIRYTANNSLLEAAATGCNIVISSDIQDNSYIPNEYITLTGMKVDEAVEAIQQTMSTTFSFPLSKHVNSHFSWERVQKETHELLSSI